MHKLFIPKQAVGANLVYFDFFNDANSGLPVKVWSVIPVVSGAVAVTGILGVDLLLIRTSAIGTGGTAATKEGSTITAATFSGFDCSATINLQQFSARLTPSGGATAGAILSYRSVFTEETSSASYVQLDMVATPSQIVVPVTVNPGTGIAVIQGTVPSVGNIGFDVMFSF